MEGSHVMPRQGDSFTAETEGCSWPLPTSLPLQKKLGEAWSGPFPSYTGQKGWQKHLEAA